MNLRECRMATKQTSVVPLICNQHSRFKKQDGWLLRYLCLSLSGKIALSGWNMNTRQTFLDVYSVKWSDSRDTPTISYSKEFEKYSSKGKICWGRLVSFSYANDDHIVTCVGDKLEVMQVSKDEVLRYRTVKDVANCLSVRKREIFIGFYQSNNISVYDVMDLKEMKSIILQELQDAFWPWDMTAINGRILICEGLDCEYSNHRSLMFEENGTTTKIMCELEKPVDIFTSDWDVPPPVEEKHWYVNSVTASENIGVVAVLWYDKYYLFLNMKVQISFYSLLDEDNSSFLNRDVKYGITRIILSDRGDRMVTGNELTGEVQIYDMSDLFTYDHLKPYLSSKLQKGDCLRLIKYFSLPKNQSDVIMKRVNPMKYLFLVLEQNDIIGPSNVDRLTDAFHGLKMKYSCCNVTKIYQRSRPQPTYYEEFLASLSTYLTFNLPDELYRYFNISKEEKAKITSSKNPRLSFLLALDEIAVISPSEVGILQQPFTEFKLLQAVAKVQEYQSNIEDRTKWMHHDTSLTKKEKRDIFIRILQKRIKGWYETMSPIPWQKSCRWKSTDLFVGCSLVLTDPKTGQSVTSEHGRLHLLDIFSHDMLKYETRIILKGDPGSGKTMVSSQLAYEWSQGKINEVDIFIFLPLKFVQNRTLVEATRAFYFPVDKTLCVADIEKFILDKRNRCCFLLDGLEEYHCEKPVESSEVMQVMTKAKYPSCKVVVTSRSDYIQDLPSIPTLKIGALSEKERDSYMKVVLDDSWKILEVKKVMEDTSFMQDFCTVPLLFVLGVHKIESIASLLQEDFDRVSPFMENIVASFFPHFHKTKKGKPVPPEIALKTKRNPLEAIYVDNLDHRLEVLGPLALENLAFKGLRRNKQQLSWKLSFIEKCVKDGINWIYRGILVFDESYTSSTLDPADYFQIKAKDTQASCEKVKEESYFIPDVEFADGESESFQPIHKSLQETESDRELLQTSVKNLVSPRTETSHEIGASSASAVPAQVRFIHKLFQEWFAARQMAAAFQNYFDESLRSLDESNLVDAIDAILYQINPADVHYVYRFTCYLCPLSCHLIIKHLLKNYAAMVETKPEYIIDCICLCFAEYDAGEDVCLKNRISEVCKEDITIRAENGRFLQKSKLALVRFAVNHNISIRKLLLIDVVVSATEFSLRFASGLVLGVLHTLEAIEVSRCDETLSYEDYINLLKFIGNSSTVRQAYLIFPTEPPLLDEETWCGIKRKDLKVKWIGKKIFHTLDSAAGKWMPFGRKPIYEESKDSPDSRPPPRYQQVMELEAEATISRDGGALEVPNTGVKLFIPPNAFEDEKDQHLLKMKIVSPGTFKDPATSFSSNTSTIVQLLSNNVELKQTVVLTLPHCLELEVDRGDGCYTAKVFVSHHEEGTTPVWEENPNLLYYLDDTKCIIWLDSLCSVKFQVNDVIVKGKKIKVCAAGKEFALGDNNVELKIGYYLDLPGENLRISESFTHLLNKPFVFLKEWEMPLTVKIQTISPKSWKSLSQLQEIPFKCIANYEEYSYPIVFKNEKKGPSVPTIIFCISQGDRSCHLTVHPQVKVAHK